MKNLRTIFTAFLFVVPVLFACRKEKTSANEQPTSINYGNGIVENFQRGPNGAVIIYSNWINKTETDWTGFGTSEIKTVLPSPSLTDDVRNKGAVLVYFEYNDIVRVLPTTWSDGQFVQETDYTFEPQKINIGSRIAPSIAISGIVDIRFRYVLIPGTSPAGGNGRMSAPVDYNDYNAVCEYYGIPK